MEKLSLTYLTYKAQLLSAFSNAVVMPSQGSIFVSDLLGSKSNPHTSPPADKFYPRFLIVDTDKLLIPD